MPIVKCVLQGLETASYFAYVFTVCTFIESSITHVYYNCAFSYSAYSNCNLGDLRLVGGQNEREGRIEVCLNNVWGTIADDNWHSGDAKIACRQLGFAAYG